MVRHQFEGAQTIFSGMPSSQALNGSKESAPHPFKEASEFGGSSLQSTNNMVQSFALQESAIEVGSPGEPALPQDKTSLARLILLCLFATLPQAHIVYFLIDILLQYFRYCNEIEIVLSTIEIGILLLCILLDVHARYSTYRHYMQDSRQGQGQSEGKHEVWNHEGQHWKKVSESQLRVGQIIRVKSYLYSNIRNPVNMLPIHTESGVGNVFVKTIWLDKQEELRKVRILDSFKSMLILQHNLEMVTFTDQLFDCSIVYKFRCEAGNSFEAALRSPRRERSFSNADIIARGVPILMEKWIVGIVLPSLQSRNTQRIEAMVTSRNKVCSQLSRYVIYIFCINACLGIIVFLINLCLTIITTVSGEISFDYKKCFTLTVAADLMNTVSVSMYFLVYLQRLVGTRRLESLEMRIKNRVKSAGEFGETDTIIMDDYFFIQKPLLEKEDVECLINSEAELEGCFYHIIEALPNSKLLRQEMYDHIVPICKYYRLNDARPTNNITVSSPVRVRLAAQEIINENCVDLLISVSSEPMFLSESHFALRVRTEQMFTGLQYIQSESLRDKFQTLMNNSNDRLILMLQIKKVERNHDLRTSLRLPFEPYCLIVFNEDHSQYQTELIRCPLMLQKYNYIIMTTRNWKYFSGLLSKTGIKAPDDRLAMLQQKPEDEMEDIIRNHLDSMRRTERQKQTILCLNSSMITYLSRERMRGHLRKMVAYCKYTVFYECSQYEKEMCAVNLFKIFPGHIYLSNYACDANIFKWSNLSVCERDASSQHLTTAVLNKYIDLQELALREAIRAIQLTQAILDTHVFKNGLFLACQITAFFLIFRGGSIDLNSNYVPTIYMVYNIFFTSLPVIFRIFYASDIYVDPTKVAYIRVNDLLLNFCLAYILGISVTLLAYFLVRDQFVTNLFFVMLVQCIFIGNLYHLYKDDSESKKLHVLVVILQITIAVLFLFLVTYFGCEAIELVTIDTNFDGPNLWLALSTCLICPLFLLVLMYTFSLGKKNPQGNNNTVSIQPTDQQQMQLYSTGIISLGKQMHFRHCQ